MNKCLRNLPIVSNKYFWHKHKKLFKILYKHQYYITITSKPEFPKSVHHWVPLFYFNPSRLTVTLDTMCHHTIFTIPTTVILPSSSRKRTSHSVPHISSISFLAQRNPIPCLSCPPASIHPSWRLSGITSLLSFCLTPLPLWNIPFSGRPINRSLEPLFGVRYGIWRWKEWILLVGDSRFEVFVFKLFEVYQFVFLKWINEIKSNVACWTLYSSTFYSIIICEWTEMRRVLWRLSWIFFSLITSHVWKIWLSKPA